MHIAAECFMREFWDLEEHSTYVEPDWANKFEQNGITGSQDLPHCELLPEDSRICFVRANEVICPVQGVLPFCKIRKISSYSYHRDCTLAR